MLALFTWSVWRCSKMAAPQRYSSKILLEYLPEIWGDRQHRFRRGAETFGHLRYGLIFSGLKMWISLLSNFLKRSKRMVITLNIVFSWGWMKLQQNSDLRLGCSTISCRANKVQVGLIQIKESCMPRKRTKKIADLSDLWLKDMFWGTCAHRRTAAWKYLTMSCGHPYAPSQVYSGFCRETYGATSRGDIEPPKNLPMMSAYHFYNS